MCHIFFLFLVPFFFLLYTVWERITSIVTFYPKILECMSPYNKDIFHHNRNIMIILLEFNIKTVLLYNRPYSHFPGISVNIISFTCHVPLGFFNLEWSQSFLSFMMTCSEKSGELFCRMSLSLYLSDLFLMIGFWLNILGKTFYIGDDLFF